MTMGSNGPQDGAAPLVDLLGSVCLTGVALAGAWLAGCVVLCVVARLRRNPALAAPAPRWVRLVVAAALGATPCVAGPAMAGTGGHDARSAAVALPVPERTLGGVTPARWTVRPGDSLWSIAAHRLATPHSLAPAAEDVDTLWRATYRRNRAVIGPDPDLIQPGTRLRLPHAPRGAHR